MKILFITLTNIGDVLLSLPALDSLLAAYPQAKITVICGERPAQLFAGNPYIKECLIYRKHRGLKNQIELLSRLNRDKYDLVIDLRNSALPFFLRADKKTYPWFNAPPGVAHMRDRHLYKVKRFVPEPGYHMGSRRNGLEISGGDKVQAEELLAGEVSVDDRLVLICPGARSHIKRWPADRFAKLADRLIEELKVKIAIVGDENDSLVCQALAEDMANPALNLCAKTGLKTLGALMQRSDLVVSCDSACLHLSSYLDRPLLAIFGPTNEAKYGPWSARSEVVRSNIACRPCEAAQCKVRDLECMSAITVGEVYDRAKKLL